MCVGVCGWMEEWTDGWVHASTHAFQEKTKYILHAMLSMFTMVDICPSAGIEDIA